MDRRTFSNVGIRERDDLQEMIWRSPVEFFGEMGEPLMPIGKEIRPSPGILDDRIDLLAVDKNGAVVVIELKRGANKLQRLQALSYAGMISKWTPPQIVRCRSEFAGKPDREAQDEIVEFVEEVDAVEDLNRTQRIVLVAEEFDYQVLVTAEWLNEKHSVDIRCYRLTLASDGPNEFLSCVCVYPPPELADHARRRRLRSEGTSTRWSGWEEALAEVSNKALVEFFLAELASGRENYLPKRIIRYRIGGKRRWSAHGHKKVAYTWQSGRFTGDEEFWRQRLSDPASVVPVKDGRSLRFHLHTAEDFKAFKLAVESELAATQFANAPEDEEVLDTAQ